MNDIRCLVCNGVVWERAHGDYYCPNCSKSKTQQDSEAITHARNLQY